MACCKDAMRVCTSAAMPARPVRTAIGGKRPLFGGTLVAACALILLSQLTGCSPERAVAPTAFVSFSDKEGAFTCKYPEGWEKESGGRSDYSWAKFTKGSAQIMISADVTGSLL